MKRLDRKRLARLTKKLQKADATHALAEILKLPTWGARFRKVMAIRQDRRQTFRSMVVSS